VRVRPEDDEIVVRVTDHGGGVAPDELPRLFRPFYQTPRGRSYGGTGLGLHISRRVAEAHGGRLWLDETGPGGTTFAFALPRVSG
jgi:signal transduction histidine kinase